MKSYSLRRAALLSFIPPFILTVAVILGAALFSSYQETNRNDDAQMERLAEMLQVLTRHEALEGEDINLTLGGPIEQTRTLAPDRVAFRIWGGSQVVTESRSAGTRVFDTDHGAEGFRTIRHDRQRWRILTRIDRANDIVVEVAQDLRARDAVFRGVTKSLLWPLIVMFPAIILIIVLGLRRVLAPLRALSRDINARDAGNLDPVQPDRVPVEVKPLVSAINSLFARVAASLQREREFTDNAAHELRTPLAALKMRAQVLAKEMAPRARGRESLNELLAIVDRTTGLVDQLLILARQKAQLVSTVDLSALVEAAIAETRNAPEFSDHPLSADIPQSLMVKGDPDMLLILVRNLLDNSARHTSPGCGISVSLSVNGEGKTVLTVIDEGPGIPEALREDITRRFVRLNTKVPGSGLGLAIVVEICSQLGARFTLRNNMPHGLRAEVQFP